MNVYVARRSVVAVEIVAGRGVDTVWTPLIEAVQFLSCFLIRLQRSPRKLKRPLEKIILLTVFWYLYFSTSWKFDAVQYMRQIVHQAYSGHQRDSLGVVGKGRGKYLPRQALQFLLWHVVYSRKRNQMFFCDNDSFWNEKQQAGKFSNKRQEYLATVVSF